MYANFSSLLLKTLFATILLSSCISSFIDYMGSGLRLGGYRHNRVISVFVCMVLIHYNVILPRQALPFCRARIIK